MLHPTVLQYVVLKCSDRLTGALPIAGTEFTQPRGICAEQRRLKSQIIRYLRFHKSLVPFRMPFGVRTIFGSTSLPVLPSFSSNWNGNIDICLSWLTLLSRRRRNNWHFYKYVSFLSLENVSDKIRWSMDLRWQRPDKPNGFYGLKVSTDMILNDNTVPEILILLALKNRCNDVTDR